MKKSLLVLTAALMFGSLASAQTTATASAPQVPALTDVPAGHWAKDAIDRLVSRGIILGYPDGTFRGTQNLTRYEAAVIIARLLDQIRGQGTGNMNSDDLVALQNAVQELAADLAALGVRVSDLEENSVNKDDFARLEARVEEVAALNGDATAIANIQSQIDDLASRADEYDTLRADVDDNASSIAALNDLTVLLNQDILDLQDRVSAVEAAQADFVQRSDFDNLAGKVTTIDTRVTKLENAPKFSVSGTLGANYGRIAITGANQTIGVDPKTGLPASISPNFDVDRLTRQTFADNAFSNGAAKCWDTNGFAASGPVNCIDTNNHDYMSDSYLVFGVKASNLSTANGKFVVNNAAVNFYTKDPFKGSSDVLVAIDNVSADGTLNGQKFDVRYEPYRSSFKFNDYLFNNDNVSIGTDAGTVGRRGIVANIQADKLPLQPKLTVVVGTATPFVNPTLNYTEVKQLNGESFKPPRYSGYTLSDARAPLVGNYYGIRASVNPAGYGTFGVSFAQMDGGANSGAYSYLAADGVTTVSGNATWTVPGRSALGADWDLGFGVKNADGNSPFTLKGVYVASVAHSQSTFLTNGAANVAQNLMKSIDTAFYTDAKADLGIAKLGANYRYISGEYDSGKAGMSGNDNSYYADARHSWAYGPDNQGFGAGVGTNLGPIALAAYGDSYRIISEGTDRYVNFGVSAGVKFFGLKALGFYNSSKAAGNTIGADNNNFTYNLTTPYMDVADVPFAFSSTYGGVLSHDGKAADALIKNLNFTVADAYFYQSNLKANDLQVYGDYSGTIAGITIAPFGRYHMFSTPSDAVVTDTNNGTGGVPAGWYSGQSYSTWKVGVKASTQPLTSIPLQPSLFVNYAQRETTIKATNAKASELLGQVGVTLNQFILPDMKASLGYAYYQGYNVAAIATGSSQSGASATYSPKADRIYASPFSGGATPFAGDDFGSQSGQLNGIFGQLDWNGLTANYGIFKYNASNSATGASTRSVAQAFKVGYTFKF
ncbi:hypothetical protein Dxin01_02556 [Deinococcus xinjiangensis]|uniref:SLH domain-containing protein n=1 Tax=Deinococcus xinjiangensis TaxID=457454 RepID=A0ABP9VC45_9DEIO